MYLRSWNDIQEWMIDNGIIRWNVTKTGSTQDNSNVFVYDDDKTFEENKAICERVLNRASGDYLVIMGWRTEKGRTNGFSANVCYGSAPAAPTTPAAPAVSGFAGVGSSLDVETLKKDIYREIKNEFDGQRLERERKEFEEEKRDFEQKQNGVLGLLVEYLAPVAQQLAGKLRPMPRVAGLDAEEPVTAEPIHARQPEEMPSAKAYQQEEEEVFTDEESDKLFALMARFKKVEPDYLQLIESVVTMAEAGDSTYTMAKSFLIKK